MVNVINLIGASYPSAPHGLWITILNWIEGSVVNYGWVIILFTLLIKVCLSPLDFVVRFSSKKATLMQQKLAPQMARLNKKYGNDPTALRAQQNALYKREGYNGVLSCLIMIVNLAVTLTVFLTLFSSLRVMSSYKAICQYVDLENAYKTAYLNNIDGEGGAKETFKNMFTAETAEHNILYSWNSDTNTFNVFASDVSYDKYKALFEDSTTAPGEDGQNVTTLGLLDNFYGLETSLTEEQQEFVNLYFTNDTSEGAVNKRVLDLLTDSGKIASEAGAKSAGEAWKDVRENWLWIDNIWVSDNYKSPLPSYNDLKSLANSSKNKEYKAFVNNINKDLYNTVTSSVHKQNDRWNGYFILAILAAGLSFLSQYISEWMSRPKNKQVNKFVSEANPQGTMMKVMKFVLPLLMVIFVWTSSSAFGLYIVCSSLISILLSVLIGVIVDACFKKKQEAIYAELEKETLKSLKRNQKRG